MTPKEKFCKVEIMPYRRTVFANNQIYHVLNRGVAGTPIFLSPKEYQRFLDMVDYYHFENSLLSFSHYSNLSLEDKELYKKKLKETRVRILAYCLIPNHFHLLLEQQKDDGVRKMLSNLQNGYVRYFNLKNKRIGPLFQSIFKAVMVETDEQLLHVSRYIHLNPTTSYLVETNDLLSYRWSSFSEYLQEKPSGFTDSSFILKLVGGQEKYKKFVFDQVEYQRELDKIKHLCLENPYV